mmetsp:Transcript_10283/g.14168  ORF Transcript_10283/g.14168 Transcript_10283/m.14168 type:complete len:280 (+) Transcript_10283:73-912(+)|eukprot:CAMPEP_0185263432 /NCGR_PEP_ID=MMETSP1359-20130426/15188_1 /TAXON_ID=552665 /ORGANISM="Bigelowiella longifila, Strain CCMP242" /LENGTH=279 /DNA_ID=CAMNT_0027850971 /DNA_START=73 /DNA_END=912 /DNA_ORIENTATION=+
MRSSEARRILGIDSSASGEEIRRAYKKLALKFHPDKNPDDPEGAKKRFQDISEAYKTLSDDPLANLNLEELLEKIAAEFFVDPSEYKEEIKAGVHIAGTAVASVIDGVAAVISNLGALIDPGVEEETKKGLNVDVANTERAESGNVDGMSSSSTTSKLNNKRTEATPAPKNIRSSVVSTSEEKQTGKRPSFDCYRSKDILLSEKKNDSNNISSNSNRGHQASVPNAKKEIISSQHGKSCQDLREEDESSDILNGELDVIFATGIQKLQQMQAEMKRDGE